MPAKPSRKWLKIILIAVAILLVIAIALPFLIPVEQYIPYIEQQASAKLKEPVSIKSIRFSALPLPHLTIGGISVGKTDDITVKEVTVTPDLMSLLGSTKVIRSITIDSPVLTQKAIDKIPTWTKSDTPSQQPPQVRVESIRLDDALLKLDKASFGPFDAKVSLNAKGEPEQASFVTKDGKLKAFIKPDKSNYLIDATAKAWKVPMGPAVEFDDLTLKGVATTHDATFSEVTAKLYGGTINGKISAGWQKGLQVKGEFTVTQVELKTLVPLFSQGLKVSGKLTAKPVFSAQAADASQLVNAMRLDTPFSVQNGVLYGVDIEKAAMSMIKKDTTGGETRFDQLTGQMAMERASYHFTQLKITSGALGADGNVNISPKKELSGRINAEVKTKIGSPSIPLNVSGTVEHPMLLPSAASLAGAALGTAVLPGVGTGVGAKAGSMIEGMFGSKEKKK